MAEVTGLRNNALPYPIYGAPWGVVFPLLDADGDLVSPSSPDSEISKNGDTAADCTNEAVEIATTSKLCYLLLTATEMTCDVAVVKVQSTGAKDTVLSFYPRKLVTIRSGTSASGGVSTSTIVLDASASAVDDFYNGMVCIATIDSNVEVRVISDYTGSTQTATVVPDWNVAPDNNDTFIVKLPEGVQINQANVTHIAGTAQTARDIGASVLLSSGTGTGQVTLTSGRVNADMTHIATAAVSTTTAQIGVNLVNIAGSAVNTSSAQLGVNVVNAAGTAWGSGAITAGSIASNAIAAAKIASGAITSAKFAAGAIDAAAIANGAIDAATFAADVDAEFLSYIVDDATRIDASALNTATVTTIPAILTDTAEIGAAGAGLTALATAANLSTVAGYLDTEIAAILADTNELQTDWADGGRLDLILDARASQSSVNTIDGIVDDILLDTAEIGTAGAGLTNINLPDQTMNITGDITGNLSGSVGSVTGAVGSVTGLTAADVGAIKTVTDKLDDTLEDDAGTFRFTTNSLEQAPTGGSAPSAADIRAEIDANSTQLAAILTDTGTTLDGKIDAIKAKTDSLTFTVANKVDSNIKSVADTTVTGAGTAGDPWGP